MQEATRVDPAIVAHAVGVVAQGTTSSILAAGLIHGTAKVLHKTSAETKALQEVVERALIESVIGAVREEDVDGGEWLVELQHFWDAGFTPRVIGSLLGLLANPSPEAQRRFAIELEGALRDSGFDPQLLDRAIRVDEFTALLPRHLWDELNTLAVGHSELRQLAAYLIGRRAAVRGAGDLATPGEFREDLWSLLEDLELEARTHRLPRYLPHGVDVARMNRVGGVRAQLRHHIGDRSGITDCCSCAPTGGCQLSSERLMAGSTRQPWPTIAAENPRLIVLAGPG